MQPSKVDDVVRQAFCGRFALPFLPTASILKAADLSFATDKVSFLKNVNISKQAIRHIRCFPPYRSQSSFCMQRTMTQSQYPLLGGSFPAPRKVAKIQAL